MTRITCREVHMVLESHIHLIPSELRTAIPSMSRARLVHDSYSDNTAQAPVKFCADRSCSKQMVLVIFRPPSRVRPVLPLGAAVFSDRSRQSHAGLPSKSSSRFPGFGFRSGKLVLRSSSADAKPPPGKSFGRGLAAAQLAIILFIPFSRLNIG